VRQGASGRDTKRPNSGAPRQNPAGGHGDDSSRGGDRSAVARATVRGGASDSGAPRQNRNPEPVLDALVEAANGWSDSRDPAELRRQLTAILALVEATEVA